VRLGIKKLFGIPIRHYDSKHTSPNDLIALSHSQMPLVFIL
jgi:hypothetical protein